MHNRFASEKTRCQQVGLWCRRNQDLLSQLRRGQVPEGGLDSQMANWQGSFAALEAESGGLLGAMAVGSGSLPAVPYLWERAQELGSRFARFLGQCCTDSLIHKREVRSMDVGERIPMGAHRLPPVP